MAINRLRQSIHSIERFAARRRSPRHGGAASFDFPATLTNPRLAYYYLVNCDEYPEVLPLAAAFVQERLQFLANFTDKLPRGLADCRDEPSNMPRALESVRHLAAFPSLPWSDGDPAVARRLMLHYLTQYLPTVVVDGCWLQGALRVPLAHTEAGARLGAAYVYQLRALVEDPQCRPISDYREVYRHLLCPVDDVSSRSFCERREFLESSFELPILLLSIGQFPRTFLPELIGLHLGLQAIDLASFSRMIVRDARVSHSLPATDQGVAELRDPDQGQVLAVELARRVLDDSNDSHETWRRLWAGLAMAADAWVKWLSATREAAPTGPPDLRQQMIEILCRKAAHAVGYHAHTTLGNLSVDDYFRAGEFDAVALLDALADSRFIERGNPKSSPFLRAVTAFGGPMFEVFSPAEIVIIENWIRSLTRTGEPDATWPSVGANHRSAGAQLERLSPTQRSPTFLRLRKQKQVKCSVRELYHRLVNLEFSPDILPVAERFANDRLARSIATMTRGERPIPCDRYDPDVLDRWVYARHREQVDSYRPPADEPRISKEQFVESTLQLAPLILIDGSWLQGLASPALIHSSVGSMLFHIFYGEIGAGNAAEHHANIYRDLLTAMGERVPSVETKEFANWPRLQESSFDLPVLWLSLSCFPRHFLPEIQGLTLAVELAGLGGPYREAHDTLRLFGLPTLFVDVHNAADNVVAGHSGWALNAIKRHMDDVTARDGPHNADYHWHRVWSGVRATLPQISRASLILHRMTTPLFPSRQTTRLPQIFQT